MLGLCAFLISSSVPYGHVVPIEALTTPLGEALGRPVRVAKALSQHCVLVMQAPNPEVGLRAVATAIHARLIDDGKGGLELVRTDEETRAVRETRADERQQWLERFLKRFSSYRAAAASKPIDQAIGGAIEEEAKAWIEKANKQRTVMPVFRVGNLLPAAAMLQGLVVKVGLHRIAAIPSGEIRVYEDAPVQTAEPLPSYEDVRAEYISDTDRSASLGLKALIGTRAKGSRTNLPIALPPDNGRVVVRWRLQCTAGESAITFLLQGYDRNGQRVDQAELRAIPTEFERGSTLYAQEEKTNPDGVWISLTEKAKQAAGFEGSGSTTPPAWYVDPVASEPLDQFVREALVGLARQDRSPCVAFDVPDSLWQDVRNCVSDGRVSLNALRRMLEDRNVYSRITEAGFTAWASKDVESVEALQANRSVLRIYAKSFGGNSLSELRAAGKLFHNASRQPGPMSDLWWQLAQRFDPDHPANAGFGRDVYTLVGGISDANWPQIARGGVLRADQLGVTEEMKRYLAFLPEAAVEGSTLRDVERHAPELFPNGDFGGATISIRAMVSRVVRAWPEGSPEGTSWAAMSFVSDLLRIPAGSLTGGAISAVRESCEARLSSHWFREGTESRVDFHLGLPRYGAVHQTGPRSVSVEPNPYRYADLPAATRDRNWALAVQKVRKGAPN